MSRNNSKPLEAAERGRFFDYLGQRKLRRTQERATILHELFTIRDHFDVESLLYKLRKKGHAVSRATIYRTLKHLLEAGLLRRVDLGRQRASYEPVLGHEHHEHLVCLACGKVVEFRASTMEHEQDRVCEEYRFKPVRHSYQILGYCEACQAGA